MKVFNDIKSLRETTKSWRKNGETIGFVPTMGYLHQGHLSLIGISKGKASKTIASIFVNPTQFNDPKDFEKYPIDLDRDFKLLESVGTDAVLVPTKEMIYQNKFQSWVELAELPKVLEGASRPGHFKGVSTVVTILFNLVEPDLAVFGEKDFQQLRIIETMVRDLHLDIEIVRGSTFREDDGLAMSSRNVRLSPEARKIAPTIYKSLSAMRELVSKGEKDVEHVIKFGRAVLSEHKEIKVDYLQIVDEATLLPLKSIIPASRFLVAVELGGIRLIDNIGLE